MAHRAGGDLAAENSVAGLVAAADRNIPWLETDIQRAGDGSYIVNHDDIHAAGKKAIVWTVNSRESAEKFGLTQVDGIITDFPLLVEEVLAERSEKSDAEAITDFFFAAEE